MTRVIASLLALGLLSACATDTSNPLQPEPEPEPEVEPDFEEVPQTENSINNGRAIGSAVQIAREEALGTETGGGYALDIEYQNDQGQDVFFVDNLPFDGDNTYNRGGTATSINAIGQLDADGRLRVYEGDPTTTDPVTGNVIETFTSRAVYGRSESGASEFAIVRSGSYRDYGFGGFVYQRNELQDDGTPVVLVIPREGDAEYLGDYGGMRIYNGTGGLNYVTGDARMVVDFKDFNEGDAGVRLTVSNRRLLDLDGNDVTAAYLGAVEANAELTLVNRSTLPALIGDVGPGTVVDLENGEATTGIGSEFVFTDGTVATALTGNYYAILSGANAEEIVGIAVGEGENAFVEGTTVQETGGFVVNRQ